jgi:hypothetical protein
MRKKPEKEMHGASFINFRKLFPENSGIDKPSHHEDTKRKYSAATTT